MAEDQPHLNTSDNDNNNNDDPTAVTGGGRAGKRIRAMFGTTCFYKNKPWAFTWCTVVYHMPQIYHAWYHTTA